MKLPFLRQTPSEPAPLTQAERDELNDFRTNYAMLVGIQREGRSLKFTYWRNGEQFEIECYATIEDNVSHWKALAGLG